MKRAFVILLALALMLSGAALAQMNDPAGYIGRWVGGPSYGEAHEYTMDITGYASGRFSVDLELYRVWGFEEMEAELIPNTATAVLMTNNADDYLVEGRLYFGENTIGLEILRSTYAALPEGTYVQFE